MAQERTSWQIKDEAILTELVTMMEISSAECALLGQLKGQAEVLAPEMTKAFYGRLFQHTNTAEYLEGISMDRLNSMLATWFIELFNGVYDEDYARRRINIGRIHVRIGLPLRYPLAMMDVIMVFGEQVAHQSDQPDVAMTAFRKALALDVAIFNQAYEDNQMKHLADLVGGERLARLLLSGAG
ncbi:MAG: Globin-coupled histidine kinase [Chloroflexaceae bacterium]|nr:Globin-coupled histidine kinase [Chloroflexaceae bacterium]